MQVTEIKRIVRLLTLRAVKGLKFDNRLSAAGQASTKSRGWRTLLRA